MKLADTKRDLTCYQTYEIYEEVLDPVRSLVSFTNIVHTSVVMV